MLRIACLLLVSWLADASAQGLEPRRVLLLYDERIELPGLSVVDASLVRTLSRGLPAGVEIYREEMDLSRLGSQAYLPRLREHLRQKYAERKMDVVVAVMGPAVTFVLNHGEHMFPGAAIVFCGIDATELAGRAVPPNATGVLVKREFAPTLDLALQLHPGTKRVAVVGGTSPFDVQLLGEARRELRPYEGRLSFTWLTHLALPALLEEVSRLPPDSVLLYVTMFRDGAGNPFVPHEVIERLAAASSAPVYAFIDQYLGRGIVGGHLYSLSSHGEEAGRLALEVLAGARPLQVISVSRGLTRTQLDGRQLKRWGIAESRLPPDAVVRFRDVPAWHQYRGYIFAAAAIMALQALLIGALLLQRSWRRRAQAELRESARTLAHAHRLAGMGELTAMIAHEVNQPLGAILCNAEAAEALLESRDPPLAEVREILADIRRNDLRADASIRRIRTMLRRREMQAERLDVNELVDGVLHLVAGDAQRRRVQLRTALEPALPKVSGDQVSLQQVLLNLAINAMDAMSGTPPAGRELTVRTRRAGAGMVEVSVADRGAGIAAEQLPAVFKPFYTTKPEGMGLGLSIARSIIAAHHGRIWAEGNPQGGTIFHFSLPAA